MLTADGDIGDVARGKGAHDDSPGDWVALDVDIVQVAGAAVDDQGAFEIARALEG